VLKAYVCDADLSGTLTRGETGGVAGTSPVATALRS
jgi:hypothetical protein